MALCEVAIKMQQRVSGLVVPAGLVFSERCLLRSPLLAKTTCHHTDIASENKALMHGQQVLSGADAYACMATPMQQTHQMHMLTCGDDKTQ